MYRECLTITQSAALRPLLPKPDREELPPAKEASRAGGGRRGVVRGCPLGTDFTLVHGTLVAQAVRLTCHTVVPLAASLIAG